MTFQSFNLELKSGGGHGNHSLYFIFMLTQCLSVLGEVRECLKLDPDHKQCFSHYKQVKKLNKQIMSAEELIQQQRCVLLTNHKHCCFTKYKGNGVKTKQVTVKKWTIS